MQAIPLEQKSLTTWFTDHPCAAYDPGDSGGVRPSALTSGWRRRVNALCERSPAFSCCLSSSASGSMANACLMPPLFLWQQGRGDSAPQVRPTTFCQAILCSALAVCMSPGYSRTRSTNRLPRYPCRRCPSSIGRRAGPLGGVVRRLDALAIRTPTASARGRSTVTARRRRLGASAGRPFRQRLKSFSEGR